MGIYEENRRLDDLVHGEEEKRRRSEEARRKKAEVERKQKEREEAKRKKAEAEKQRKEKEERRRERDERREQSERHRIIAEYTGFDTENSFSPKLNNSGIIKPSKPQFNSIGEIQDAQKAQKKLIGDLEKKQWDDLVAGTDDLAMINTQNVANAQQGLKDLKLELTAAYGLGDNGYWANNKKSYGQKPAVKAETNNAHIYAKGTGGVSDYDTGMKHALGVGKPNPADAHKYAKGTGGVSDYNIGMQHALGGSKKTGSPSGALGAKETQINQKLDEIVNGQDLSETKQEKLQEDLQKLNAEKNVITWQQQNPNATSEDFDSKKDYYNEQINRAADEYLNEYAGRDDEETKTAWADYSEKVHGIVAQRDAYNRAAMGVDDLVGDTQTPVEDEKPITSTQSLIDDMFNAGGEGVSEAEAKSDEALGSYLDDMFNDGGK